MHTSVHACTCTHIHTELVDAQSQVQIRVGQQQQPLAFDYTLYRPEQTHTKRNNSLHRLQDGGIWILIARPVWPTSAVDNVDYFKLVRSQGVKAGSQKHSRSSLLQIQGKQMEMRLSQLDSMWGVCVAKYSYLFPLSMRSEACPHINSVLIGSFITKAHLMNP